MTQSSLVKRHPGVKVLNCEPDLTHEEVYQQVEPYMVWRLLELDGLSTILICTSCESGVQMIILQGRAAEEWIVYHLSRLPDLVQSTNGFGNP